MEYNRYWRHCIGLILPLCVRHHQHDLALALSSTKSSVICMFVCMLYRLASAMVLTGVANAMASAATQRVSPILHVKLPCTELCVEILDTVEQSELRFNVWLVVLVPLSAEASLVETFSL